MRRARLMALLLLTLLASALAATSARAQVSCSVTFSTLAFPTNIDVLTGASVDSAGSLAVSCTGITGTTKVIFCFALDNGTYGATGGWRQMGSGANRLNFQIYRDAARSLLWDATTANRLAMVLTATAPSSTVSTYGRIAAAQQTAVPGAYTTTITSTVYGTTFTGATPACSAVTSNLGTRTFAVTATVVSSCSVTAGGMTFPATGALTANIDATSTLGVICTRTTPYYVRLDGGLAAATNPTQRKMTLGAKQITYGLYRDAARTLGWGQTDGVDTGTGTGTAANVNHTVYGRVPPQTTPPSGTYVDTVIAVISF